MEMGTALVGLQRLFFESQRPHLPAERRLFRAGRHAAQLLSSAILHAAVPPDSARLQLHEFAKCSKTGEECEAFFEVPRGVQLHEFAKCFKTGEECEAFIEVPQRRTHYRYRWFSPCRPLSPGKYSRCWSCPQCGGQGMQDPEAASSGTEWERLLLGGRPLGGDKAHGDQAGV